MAEQPQNLVKPTSSLHQCSEQHASLGGEETRKVETVVVALIPEYEQVKVRDSDGHVYALTPMTRGLDLLTLREGQRVVCTVTRTLPRVLCAEAVA
jgi:hypothetical protein